MIKLPAGCTINYEVTITLRNLSTEFLVWYQEIGGVVVETEYYDNRGQKRYTPQIHYGLGRLSHRFNDGSGQTLVRFKDEDAGVALMLLIKFPELVVGHNIQDIENMKEKHYG